MSGGYSRVWADDQPITDSDADQLAIDINDVRGDLHERMVDILGVDGDWNGDPVVPIGYDLTSLFNGVTAAGSQTNIERTAPWYAGHLFNTAGTQAKSLQSIDLTAASATMTIYVPLVLPVGVTITAIRARVFYNNAGHTINGTFKSTKDGSDIYSVALEAPAASASAQWIAATTPSHLTAADEQHGFLMDFNNNNTSTATALKLYSVQVKYTHPGGAVR